MTVQELQTALDTHDKGLLKRGAHKPDDREFCALEFVSILHNEPLNDNPGHLPDIRPINDGLWYSDKARTDAMLPLIVALWEWEQWSDKRKMKWAKIVAIKTVNVIISELPNLPKDISKKCKESNTLSEAANAARAAADAARAAANAANAAANAANAAANAANAAANAANAAANAPYSANAADAARAAANAARAAANAARAAADAAYAAANTNIVLVSACQIWIDAAKETENVT